MNNDLEKKLYAYELGLLDDDERREFELYLLENLDLLEEAMRFDKVADLLRQDPDVQSIIARLDQKNKYAEGLEGEQKSSFFGNLWSRLIPTFAVTAIILMILLLKDWNVYIDTTHEAYASENRVAVMYFENLADPADSLHLGAIAANLIITDLSESNFMQVVSSQRLYDVLKLLGMDSLTKIDINTATRVADTAKAEWILMGTILQSKPNLIITTQLISKSSGNIITSQKICGDEDEDIFSVVDKLTLKIKQDLSLPAGAYHETDRMVAEMTTNSPEAYRYYIEGQDYYRKYYYDEAERSFEKALEFDSTLAMAYYYLTGLKDRKLISKAVEYSDKASNRERGYIAVLEASISGDIDKALEKLEEIIRRYPNEKA